MRGWHLGDATFVTFELPIIGVTELVLGFGATALHVASALVFTVVAVAAMALAATGSQGAAKAARCAVVIAVLAVPLLAVPGVVQELEEPDHAGSAVFVLLAALLIDRAPGWRDARWRYAAPPLLALLLCAGQLGDLTVRYAGVPAVVGACCCRALGTRGLSRELRRGRWLTDAAFALAAVVSVPLESAVRALLVDFGGFVMVAPQAKLSAPRLWPHHATVTWLDIRELFGAVPQPGAILGSFGAVLAVVCLTVAILGMARVAWTWWRATAAEWTLVLAVLLNAMLYLASVMTLANNQRELALVLPCGAVLAARTCVPARFTGTGRATAVAVTTVSAATAAIAVLPLAAAATRPPLPTAQAPLATWLEAHHLSYGIAGYWDASVTTLQSGGQVRVRAVDLHHQTSPPGFDAHVPGWETNVLWYDPARYDATFIVADRARRTLYPARDFEAIFGKPAHAYPVGRWLVLVYRKNLLNQVLPVLP